LKDLPTGTVAFLFTDIEGSTALRRRLGDRADEHVLPLPLLPAGGVREQRREIR